jgi:hypothetical protein
MASLSLFCLFGRARFCARLYVPVCVFVCVRSSVRPLVRPFVCARLCARLCTRLCARLCVRFFARLCLPVCVCPFVCPFVCSFVCPFACPFVWPTYLKKGFFASVRFSLGVLCKRAVLVGGSWQAFGARWGFLASVRCMIAWLHCARGPQLTFSAPRAHLKGT